MSTDANRTLLEPIGDGVSIAGYAVATSVDKNATAVAGKYLNDSLLLASLTDRVYQLLQDDLYLQRERVNNYSHPRWL